MQTNKTKSMTAESHSERVWDQTSKCEARERERNDNNLLFTVNSPVMASNPTCTVCSKFCVLNKCKQKQNHFTQYDVTQRVQCETRSVYGQWDWLYLPLDMIYLALSRYQALVSIPLPLFWKSSFCDRHRLALRVPVPDVFCGGQQRNEKKKIKINHLMAVSVGKPKTAMNRCVYLWAMVSVRRLVHCHCDGDQFC